MKITLSRKAICSKIDIPAGEYMVVLAADSGQMSLVGGGKTFKIPAVRRRASAKTKVTTVTFLSGGGVLWSLIVSTPKSGEWIATMEISKDKDNK